MRRRVYLFGRPAAHSLSPVMHAEALSRLGLDWEYRAVEVEPDDLGRAVDELLRAPDAVGANITIPHKVRVIHYLDALSDEARMLGAVNTVVRDGTGRLTGHNTDAGGLAETLSAWGFRPRGCRAAILGSGGAARAAIAALAGEGVDAVTVLSRRPHMTVGLDEVAPDTRVQVHPWSSARDVLPVHLGHYGDRPSLLVNATPVGMWPASNDSPLDGELVAALPAGTFVMDLIYRPPLTRLLLMARERGLPVMGGTGMLVGQGIRSLSLWLGRLAEECARRAMVAAVNRELEG